MRKRSAACSASTTPTSTELLHSTATVDLIHEGSSAQSWEKAKGTSGTADGRVSSDQSGAVSALA
jgi:hypothetical protein